MGTCCDVAQNTNQLSSMLARPVKRTEMPSPLRIEYLQGMWGRAYPLVLLCEYKSINYIYEEIDSYSLRERKDAGDLGELGGFPIVYFWGEEMQETSAVLRALGAEHGLYNPNDWKKAGKIDMTVSTYTECFNACAEIMFSIPFDLRVTALELLSEGLLAKFLAICEKELEQNSYSRFIVGDTLTIADFVLAAFYFNILKNEKTPFAEAFKMALLKAPYVGAHGKRMLQEFKSEHLTMSQRQFTF